jgi:DnaK suppressor protein
MAAITRKSKAKTSPVSRTKVRTKVKSKPKVKADVKKKKAVTILAKTKKGKKAKAAKPKIRGVNTTVTKSTSKKAAPAKTKATAKPQTKAPTSHIASKTANPKMQPKAVSIKAKDNNEPVIIQEIPSNIAMMQEPAPENNVASSATKSTDLYMDKKQLEHFKGLLEQWKRELMEEVDQTLVEMKEAGVLADPNDCATQEETFSLELRTRDRERKLLKKIEEALQKIDNEEYGYCDACGIEIGIRRLEARPTATLCIDCKTLDEIKEKRS